MYIVLVESGNRFISFFEPIILLFGSVLHSTMEVAEWGRLESGDYDLRLRAK